MDMIEATMLANFIALVGLVEYAVVVYYQT